MLNLNKVGNVHPKPLFSGHQKGKLPSLPYFIFFLLTAFLIVLLSACGGNSPQTNGSSSVSSPTATHVVKHALGETEVPDNPQRVVTLVPPLLANALALDNKPIGSVGFGGAGVASLPAYLQDQAEGVTFLGADQPNLEKTALLQPDLILSLDLHEGIYPQLSQIAPTVLVATGDGSSDWQRWFQETATALGKTDTAEVLINRYSQRIEEFKQKMGDRLQNIQVSLVLFRSDHAELYLKDIFPGKILQDAGLSRPPSQDKTGSRARVSLEAIPQMDGDVIFLMAGAEAGSVSLIEQMKRHPLWSQLKAVQQNQVYQVSDEYWIGGNILAANRVLDDLFR